MDIRSFFFLKKKKIWGVVADLKIPLFGPQTGMMDCPGYQLSKAIVADAQIQRQATFSLQQVCKTLLLLLFINTTWSRIEHDPLIHLPML